MESKITIWEVATGKRVDAAAGNQLFISPQSAYTAGGSILWEHEYSRLATSAKAGLLADLDENILVVSEAATGQAVQRLSGHKDEVKLAAFSPNGRLLASATPAGQSSYGTLKQAIGLPC